MSAGNSVAEDGEVGGPVVVVHGPGPSEEEAAAIAAAVDAVVLSAGEGGTPVREPSRWRFSGRWWSRPVPVRRSRPG